MKKTQQNDKFIVGFHGPCLRKSGRVAALQRWWSWNEELVGSFELQLTHVSCLFNKKPSRMSGNKAYQLGRNRKRIEKELSAGNVQVLELDTIHSKPDGYIAFDWDHTSSLGDTDRYGAMLLVGIDTQHIDSWDKSRRCAFANEVFGEASATMKVCYGFSTCMPRDYMPLGYALGVACGEAPEEVRYDANSWRHCVQKHSHRLLRNVHGYNVIDANHLAIRVGDLSLEQWIRQDASRGKIDSLNGSLYLWTFEDLSENAEFLDWNFAPIEEVRRELSEHRIFPWQEYAELGGAMTVDD